MYRRHSTANLEWFGYSLLGASILALVVPLWGGELPRRLMVIIPGIVLGVVVIASSRIGAPRSAAWVSVAGAWAMLTLAAWTGGGVMSVAYVAYLVPILATGVLLGRRAAVLVLAASVISGFLLAMAEAHGWMPPDVVRASPWARWSGRSLVLGLSLAILYGADIAMERAIAGVHREVDERRRAESAARGTAERLHVAMQAARMAAWAWDLETGVITWSEEAAALIGKPFSALSRNIEEAIANIHPEDRDGFEHRVRTLRSAPSSEPLVFTHRLDAPGGRERWFEELGQYFPRQEDAPARVVGVIFDVTERRRVEELQVRIARGLSAQIGTGFFRSLVGHLGEALGVDVAFVGQLVADGRKVRTIGVFEDQALAADFEYDLRGAPCEQVIGGGVCTYPSGVQLQFPTDAALARRGIEGYAGQPLTDSDGRALGLLVVMSRRPLEKVAELEAILRIFAIRAATELERMKVMQDQAALEGQLRQSQKMETIGQLAGGVAHDFNNLLSPILGYAELLLDEMPGGGSRHEYLETIKEAAERAAALTRQLLTFSRRQVLDLRVFALDDAVAGMQRILRRTIREDIALEFRYSPGPTFVRADINQIEQILMNLVVNSQDAISGGGEIVVETGSTADDGPRGRAVTLTVSDNGTGMSPDVLEHAFEPFFTTKEKGRGTGLGLATVYGIVEQHHGRVTIENNPGGGTRVEIRLPSSEAGQEESKPGAVTAPGDAKASETVVVVEDDHAVRELARAILERRGYHVRAFPGPSQCLDAAADSTCQADLLLTDIIMPGINGCQLYERLKERCPQLRVLYMSGYANLEVDPAGARPIDVLAKPFTPDVLAQRVRKAIDSPEPSPPFARRFDT